MTEQEKEEIIGRLLERLRPGEPPSDCLLEELSVEGMMEVSLGIAICPEARKVMEALLAGKRVKIGRLGYRRCQAVVSKPLYRLLEEAERRILRMGVVVGREEGAKSGGKRILITRQMAEELAARGEKPPSGAILTPLAADVWKAR